MIRDYKLKIVTIDPPYKSTIGSLIGHPAAADALLSGPDLSTTHPTGLLLPTLVESRRTSAIGGLDSSPRSLRRPPPYSQTDAPPNA